VFARAAEDRHRLAELHLSARGDEELQERALVEGAELHRRLVGLDLGEEIVDVDCVALFLVPRGEDALLHRRRQLRHVEDLRHQLAPRETMLFTAATTRAGCGMHSCSSFALYGIGTSSVVTRRIGASRESKARRCTRSLTSAPTPPYGQPSWTTTQ